MVRLKSIEILDRLSDKILSMRGTFDGGFKNPENLENNIILNKDKSKDKVEGRCFYLQ